MGQSCSKLTPPLSPKSSGARGTGQRALYYLSTCPDCQHHSLHNQDIIFIPVSSGLQPQVPPSSPVLHTFGPFQGSTRPGGHTLAGRERGQRKLEAGQGETRVGPKLLEPAPQLRGRGGGASRTTTCGSGRRLFSRTCREATQVSANDLTHCKGGAVERWG